MRDRVGTAIGRLPIPFNQLHGPNYQKNADILTNGEAYRPKRAGECGDAAGLGGEGALALGAPLIPRRGLSQRCLRLPTRGCPVVSIHRIA